MHNLVYIACICVSVHVCVDGLVRTLGSAAKVGGNNKASRPLPASQSEGRLWWTASGKVARWPLMERPPLALSLNNTTRGKMADIQHCRVEEKEVECKAHKEREKKGCVE